MTAQDAAPDGVSLSLQGNVAKIVIDADGKHNAIHSTTWRALPGLVEAAESAPDVGVIIVRGARGNFGAGNDITELRGLVGNPAAAEAYAQSVADAMQAVEAASKPVLMAIEGLCYGASVALTLTGDLRIAADNATFAITPAKLGATYLQSDLHRLVAAIGAGQSRKMIYSGEPIGAEQALSIGLVDVLLPSGGFEQGLQELTDDLLRGSSFTLRQTKQMLRLVGQVRTPAETKESLAWFVRATQGSDFKEGLDAFLAKRRPRFR